MLGGSTTAVLVGLAVNAAGTGVALAGTNGVPAPYIFVANTPDGGNVTTPAPGTGTVTEYAPGANGDAAPVATLAGTATYLDYPTDLAVDPTTGDLVVTNDYGSVTEYAPGANGAAAPVANIVGPDTGLSLPHGVAVNASGDIFVANSYTQGGVSVTEYAPGATGDATPIATITGFPTEPNKLAVNASGDLFVSTGAADSVYEYAPGANGNATPMATIIGPFPGSPAGTDVTEAVAVDQSGNLFVDDFGFGKPPGPNSIDEYAPGANGAATPTSAITGGSTGLNEPWALAVDGSGNLYVADRTGSVSVFAAGSNGNVAPTSTITGSGTGLQNPVGVAVIGAPGSPGLGSVTTGYGSATVAFSAPALDGNSPITSYTVTATDTTNPANGGQTATGSSSPITVTGLTDGDTYTFNVVAANAFGSSPASATSTPVVPNPTASLAFTGALQYDNSATITSGHVTIDPATGTITSAYGTVVIPGLTGGSATITIAAARILGVDVGTVSVSDPSAHLKTVAAISSPLTRTPAGQVTGTAVGLYGLAGYTLNFAI